MRGRSEWSHKWWWCLLVRGPSEPLMYQYRDVGVGDKLEKQNLQSLVLCFFILYISKVTTMVERITMTASLELTAASIPRLQVFWDNTGCLNAWKLPYVAAWFSNMYLYCSKQHPFTNHQVNHQTPTFYNNPARKQAMHHSPWQKRTICSNRPMRIPRPALQGLQTRL